MRLRESKSKRTLAENAARKRVSRGKPKSAENDIHKAEASVGPAQKPPQAGRRRQGSMLTSRTPKKTLIDDPFFEENKETGHKRISSYEKYRHEGGRIPFRDDPYSKP